MPPPSALHAAAAAADARAVADALNNPPANERAARGGGASIHGSGAARRAAVAELLFFASVADVARCSRLCKRFDIDVSQPEVCDYDRRTPLHLASAEGCFSVVEWLLAEGADANPIDRFGRTPLEDAVRGDHGEVVRLLVGKGAKLAVPAAGRPKSPALPPGSAAEEEQQGGKDLVAPLARVGSSQKAGGAGGAGGSNSMRRASLDILGGAGAIGGAAQAASAADKYDLVELADSPLVAHVRIFGGAVEPEWEIDPRHLRLINKVGEGEFGVVWKASYHGCPVAVKVLREGTSPVALGDFRTEVNVLTKTHHPHCVQFLGAVTKSLPLMIVAEFLPCGSLADVFRAAARERPTMRRAVSLALGCARGMAYLHNHQPLTIIHRDLKPANLMISGGGEVETAAQRRVVVQELGSVKIADFGLSKSLKLSEKARGRAGGGGGGKEGGLGGVAQSEASSTAGGVAGGSTDGVAAGGSSYDCALGGGGAAAAANGGGGGGGGEGAATKTLTDTYVMTGETGSYRFMAPEVFNHLPYNHRVDLYAFAMIAYQLFEGVPAFWALEPLSAARAAASERRLRPEWDSSARPVNRPPVPARLRKLVEACWAHDFGDRPEFVDVVSELEAALKEMPKDRSVLEGLGDGNLARGGGGGGDGCGCSVA
jgi:serine/threonine protein kinase